MSKLTASIKLTSYVIVMLLLTAFIGFLGVTTYNEGFINGESRGSFATAQYVALSCDKGGVLRVFGYKYYCSKVYNL